MSADLACGVADWPWTSGVPIPALLPNGDRWPRIDVFVTMPLAGCPDAIQRSIASITAQAYPAAQAIRVACEANAMGEALAQALAVTRADFALVLRSGDMLAPGALAALALAARLEKADAVAGLRVIYGRSVTSLDSLSARPGLLAGGDARAGIRWQPGVAPFTGGEILIATSAIERAGGISSLAENPMAELWPWLARAGIRFARIGRPVLLQHEPEHSPGEPPPGLRIAALNDAGGRGGAGIAHRRLVEALRFGGHEVAVHTLNRESPPVAAEWTDAFPRTEAAILAEAPDLVLVGNIHGATRTSAVLGQLSRHVPVAAVLHDLFLLTGRCNHPGGCSRIGVGCDALCPTPTLYPQLAPYRIAGTFRQKRSLLQGETAVTLIANSRWTELRARDLAPAGAKICRIDMAFPAQVFRPGDKRSLRRRLALPEGDILILFSAVILDQPEKGAADLAAALAQVARPGVGFVAIGRIDDPGSFPLPDLFTPGPIGGEAELADWYGACDLHVTASQLETLGQTPIEAGLCGLPTVAYRSTGLTTAVIDGVSGILVDPRPGALAQAVAALVADPGRLSDLSRWGQIALESRNSHAAAYLGLHDMLVDRGLQPAPSEDGRIRFTADTLGTFAFAATPVPGAVGTVGSGSARPIRAARRLKQRIWGRAQPLWMRRAVYAGYLAGRRFRQILGRT